MRYAVTKGEFLRVQLLIALMIPAFLTPLMAVTATAADTQFSLVGASWGSPATPACVCPGSNAQLLTVRMMYTGVETLPGVKAVLYLPWGFRDTLTKTQVAEVKYTQPLASKDIISLAFRVDVEGWVSAGEYPATLAIYDSTSGAQLAELGLTLTLSNAANITVVGDRITLHPGFTSASITLKNIGRGGAHGVTVSITSPQQAVILTQNIGVGDLMPGDYVNLEIQLYVPSTLTNSLVPLTLNVNYVDECGLSVARTLVINSLVVERLDISRPILTALNTTLEAGIPRTVVVSVLNSGTATIKGLRATFNIPSQLVLLNGSSQWLVDVLEPGAMASTRMTLTPIGISGERTLIQIPVTLNYVDQYGVSRSDSTSIILTVIQPQIALTVDVRPQELTAGKVNEVTLSVSNTGTTSVYGVSLTLVVPQSLVLRDSLSKWSLGDLGAGEVKRLKLYFAVPLSTSGDVQAGVTINYVDPSGVARAESRNLLLTIVKSGEPLLISLNPQELRHGSNLLNVTLTNNCSEVLRDVTVVITQTQLVFRNLYGAWRVGDLSPGESRTLTLEVFVPSTVGNVIQITVAASYKDVAGATQSESRSYGVSVKPGLTLLKVTVNPDSLRAGRSGITIRISNEGENPVYNVLATLTLQGATFSQFDGSWYVGDLMPGDSRDLDVTLVVGQTTTAVQIAASLSYVDSGGVTRVESKTVLLAVTPNNAPNFKVMVEPYTIAGGRNSTMSLTVTNTADIRFKEVLVTVATGGLSLVGFDGRWYVGTLEPGESRTLRFTAYAGYVEARQSASMSITITSYSPDLRSVVTESYTLPLAIIPDPLRGLNITASSTTVTAGRVNNITLLITNPNRFSVNSITLSVTPPSGSGAMLMASDTHYVESIGPGSTATLTLPLYVPSTSSTTLSIAVSASYFDGTMTRSTSKSLSFIVALPPSLRMTSYAVLPQTITPGQTFSISMSLSNAGLGTAYNVTARVLWNPFLTPLLGSEMFVGDMSKGASTTITFSFRASSELAAVLNATTARPANLTGAGFPLTGTATRTPRTTTNVAGAAGWQAIYGNASSLRVVITISYADNVGKPYELTITIPLTVGSSNTATQTSPATTAYWTPTTAVLIAVPVAVVAALYALRRLRRK
ncbi:MAG: CARDB domain-containing protein [Zestosphaera sp.]